MLQTIYFPFVRDFIPNTNTSLCFGGSDTSLTASTQVGGEIITTSEVRGWQRLIARGQNATSHFSGTWTHCDRAEGFAYSRRWCNSPISQKWAHENVDGYLFNITGVYAPPTAPSTSLPATTNAQALAEFVSEARRAQGSFRGSTAVAELRDTLRGLRNPAMGIRNLLDSYHQRARRNTRRAMRRDPMNSRVRDLSQGQARAGSRALSETWLEYQFGIMPLINDVRDASRALNRLQNREPRVNISSHKSNETVPVIVVDEQQRAHHVKTLTEIHTSTTFNVRYYGAVKLRTDPFGSVAQETGFQVRDFLPALWEWIPYSFLVDYFTNIGNIVEAATFSRSNIAWAARTWHNDAVRDCSRTQIVPINNAVYPTSGAVEILSSSPSWFTWRRSFFSRAPYTGSLVPQLTVEIPGFRNSRRWLNIAALANLRGMRR